MIDSIVVKKELLPFPSHRSEAFFIVSKHRHIVLEFFEVAALCPKSEAFALGDAAHVSVGVSSEENRHTVLQIAEKPGREVGNCEARVEENEAYLTSTDEPVIFVFGKSCN